MKLTPVHTRRLETALRNGSVSTRQLPGLSSAPVPWVKQAENVNRDAQAVMSSLDQVFAAFEVGDGATLSFHHHYRNGDRLINAVIAHATKRGLRGLTLAPSSLFPVHEPLVEAIKAGVVTSIVTDYVQGPVADAIAAGHLATPLVLQSHGGRARAIEGGDLDIDVAFVGASQVDYRGCATGRSGSLACGPLGYAMVDAAYARSRVIVAEDVLSNNLPSRLVDIDGQFADALLSGLKPGDPTGIVSGTTLVRERCQTSQIVETVVKVIQVSGLMRDGFSFQTGAGGFTLSAVPALGSVIQAAGVKGAFISGGITGAHVAIAEAGLVERIYDVQSFDLQAISSSSKSTWHEAISASKYANPFHSAPVVDDLSVMLLGAAEVDFQFNVNVLSTADGRLIGGPGGHPDAAEGAEFSLVVTTLTAGGYSKIVPEVQCVTTPGSSIDGVVTDQGVALNETWQHLAPELRRQGIAVVSLEELAYRAWREASLSPSEPMTDGRLMAVVENRHGGVLDAVFARSSAHAH